MYLYHKIIIGAIAGDIIGSRFEFNSHKSIQFSLFDSKCDFTDDTVMTIAIADWLLTGRNLADTVRYYGNKYPDRGYGNKFQLWLNSTNLKPYNSFGNGSAMRVSPVSWLFNTLEETLEKAKESAEITHNHPEGIKGAQATAACIFLARNGTSKDQIKKYIETTFGYNLSRTCDEIRPNYEFDETCQSSVPESIICFLESFDFESAVRLAISLGGDADTMSTIAGSIAEAYYKEIPKWITQETINRIPEEFMIILREFSKHIIL